MVENCFLVCFRMVENNPWVVVCFFGGDGMEGKICRLFVWFFGGISGRLKWTFFGSRSDNTRCPKSMGFPMDSILKPDLNKLQTKTMFIGKLPCQNVKKTTQKKELWKVKKRKHTLMVFQDYTRYNLSLKSSFKSPSFPLNGWKPCNQ